MALISGKTALITGASSGIGRETALLFAQEGAQLVLTGRDTARLAETAERAEILGASVAMLSGDVRDEALHTRLVALALERFGRLDIAFNNAGTVGGIGPVDTLPLAGWRETIDTNLTSAFLAARAQEPALLSGGGGAILFTSSFVGTSVGLPGMAAYGASKAALMGLVKGLTADHAAEGLRANVLIVGGTDTSMAGSAEQKQWAAGLHALKRIAQPEEIARAALFLASDMSSFVAGSALYVDGGNAAVK